MLLVGRAPTSSRVVALDAIVPLFERKAFVMSAIHPDEFEVLADAYAFLGNSLLRPMSQTAAVGLSADFWKAFPDFGSEAVADAVSELAAWAESGSDVAESDRVRDVSVEYTQLFVGPPKPAAPPWETMNRAEGVTVGFGEPTFQMRQLLSDVGLELSNENHQYEDHMGIELLYLSELCRRAGEGEGRVAEFIAEHPLAWIDFFSARVREAVPDGYFARLLALTKALLQRQVA